VSALPTTNPHAVASFLGHGQNGPLAVVALAVVAVLVWRTSRACVRRVQQSLVGRRSENILTVVAAGIATAVSMTGMWRFFGVTLHFSGPLRVLLFAFVEISVVTSAVRARRNMAEFGAAGVDGVAVWVLTSISAALSAMDARSFAEVAFRLAAPLVAAWLWERGMAVERRRTTGRRINWRITPERILVRLGVAEGTGRAASEVDVHRRLSRLARAAKRARALQVADARAWRQGWAQRRLDTAMAAAVEHTGLASDAGVQDALLGQLGALYNAASLVDLAPRAPWDRSSPTTLRLFRLGAPAGPADAVDDVPGTPVPAVPADVDVHLTRARQVFADDLARGEMPSIRQLKRGLRIGQPRAKEVRAYLSVSASQ
jgi:hypothetical protein